MKWYFGRPEETSQVLTADGWFSTGDLGQMDERGFVKIVGRKKEMIIRGGYNVYPREVEEVIYQHPDVMEEAVVGVDDDVMGERTRACIRCKPEAGVSEEDIRAFCAEWLAKYKVPDFVQFFDEFPTPSAARS